MNANRRIVYNLAFFGVIGLALAVWAATSVISFDFVDRPYTVTAQFDTSPGLSPRFEVTYLGQRIGAISKVELGKKLVTATMKLDRGRKVPRAVDAAVRRKSAVGEPYVDLQPSAHTDPDRGPRLAGGDRIPLARTSTPLAYSDLFRAVDQLVAAVDPGDLRTLVHELAVGVDGRGDSLRQLFVGVDQLTGDLADNAQLLDSTISDLTTLTDTVATHSGAVGSSIDNLASLAQTLHASENDVAALLEKGPTLGATLAKLVTGSGSDLGCAVDALGVVASKLDRTTVDALNHVIAKSPKFLFVLSGLLTEKGLKGRVAINLGPTGPLVYPKPLGPPVVPKLRTCAEVSAVGGGAGGAPAAASSTAGPAAAVAGVPAERVPRASAPATPLAVPAPETPPSKPTSVGGGLRLSAVLKPLVPLAVILAIALGFTARRRFRSRAAVPSTAGEDGGNDA
jgi:phospholipid/cholesterol/gamma-HCH transport system substrate-binding protein